LNYGTTLAFQVLLARRFGTGSTAAAFQLTFAMWVAIAAIFSSTLTTVLVPRLADRASRAAVMRTLKVVFCLIFLVCVVLFATAGPIAKGLHEVYDVDVSTLTALVRSTAVMIVLQTLCDLGIACGIAGGRRFTPTLAPAGPSTAGAIALLVNPDLSVVSLYQWLIIGSVAELAVVAPALRLLRGTAPDGPPLLGITLATLAQYSLASSLAPLELLFASIFASPHDSAHYAFAVRSLAVAQQLLIGGALVALLGDWGKDILKRSVAFAQDQITRAVTSVVWVLGAAIAIAVLLGHGLLTLLYEHGAFSGQDTSDVYELMVLGLAGFALDAVSVTVSSMLLSRQRNDLAIKTGYVRFAVRMVAMVLGLSAFGIVGVPIAWMCASLVGLALNLRWLRVEHVPLLRARLLRPGLYLAGSAGGAAALAAATTEDQVIVRLPVTVVLALPALAALAALARTRGA
jgi:peptidoglycan biosynthesis protein MviN/MurJ (putative lipid II flippase)